MKSNGTQERNKTGLREKEIKRRGDMGYIKGRRGKARRNRNRCEKARGRKGRREGGRKSLVTEMTASPLSWHTRLPSSQEFSQVCRVT